MNSAYDALESHAALAFPLFRMTDKRKVTDLLEDTIGAIQSHRSATSESRKELQKRVDEAWASVIEASRELRGKLSGNEKLRYFTIARDEKSVIVSFQGRQTNARGDLLELSRYHPDGQFADTEAIWVRESNRTDQRLHSGDEAVKLLVRFCARNLAD